MHSRVHGCGKLLHYQPKSDVGSFSCGTQHVPAIIKSIIYRFERGFFCGVCIEKGARSFVGEN